MDVFFPESLESRTYHPVWGTYISIGKIFYMKVAADVEYAPVVNDLICSSMEVRKFFFKICVFIVYLFEYPFSCWMCKCDTFHKG